MKTIDLNGSQLRLVRQTIAKDCNEEEFDLFMAACKSYGLDPFRKQIMPLVFSKGNAKKRRMSIVVSRDGLRVIAQRCGNYRPASEKAEIVTDESQKDELNPRGLVSVAVRLWQQDNRGDWFPVIGEALWDEFAPIAEEWAWSEGAGQRQPTGEKTLEGNWKKMPVVMLTKCAEAQALRAGWPDQFAGLYAEEEMDRAVAHDMSASEAVQIEEDRLREERVQAGKSILASFGSMSLERVPHGQFADRCLEHIRTLEPEAVRNWSVQNREPLREFWAASPNDALEIKKQIEERTAKLEEAAA